MASADETRPRRPGRLAPCPAGTHPDGCEPLWRRDEVPEAAELRAHSVRRVREGHDKERRVLHGAELGCERGGVGPHERRERCGVERTEDVVGAQGLPARAERSRASAMGSGGVRRRVQLVRRDGRDVSTLYGREGGRGGGRGSGGVA